MLVPFGHESCAQPRHIDTVVVHTMHHPEFSGDDRFKLENLVSILERHDVAAHYIILRDGEVVQIVADQDIARHTGESAMPDNPGSGRVNAFSLGVELASAKDTTPTGAQYDALAELILQKIQDGIPIRHIVGHDEIALPKGRKDDPWNFDWPRLQESLAGLGFRKR
jgi:N-acetylmuramoyl-L-alanine amidase